MANVDSTELVTHYGSCHCGLIQWEAIASPNLIAWDCDCSICRQKGNLHIIIPASRFKLLSDPNLLTIYTFNTHKAQHKFCKKCGVQSFYHPRSNPDGIGIQLYSIKRGTISNIEIKKFGGQNWERAYEELQKEIGAHSKL
eukprot:UN05199